MSRALHKRGFQVWLAALGGPSNDWQRQEASGIPGLRFFDSNYKLEWMEEPWDDVAESGRWLLDLGAKCQPEIIHLNSFGHAALPWRVPAVLTAHSCVASWWKAVKSEDLPRESDRYRREVVRVLDAAAVVTAPSRAMANARAVLNISRESMAQFGFSPATRVFEAAGACFITDAWQGVEQFLEPGTGILVAENGDEVADPARNLSSGEARAIGQAALRRALGEHTYRHRAGLLESVLNGGATAGEAR